MWVTSEELKRMSEMTFEDIANDDISEIGSFKFDMDKPPADRMRKFFESGKNPYFRKTSDGTKIKISFANNGRSFEDNMVNLLSGQKQQI